jgi:two-component system, NtrC family, sensor kinase
MQCAKPGAEIASSTHPTILSAEPAILSSENARLVQELAEACEQQVATGEILGIISRPPTDLQRVFAAVVASAVRICDTYDATILQVDGNVLRIVGHDGPIPATPVVPLMRGILASRAVLDRQTIHVTDLQAEGEKYPEGTDFALRHGFRTILAVPLIRGGEAIGVIAIRRNEVRPFTDRQIDLLQTFANQPVIAIDNARLFEAEQARTRELQARSAELTEALKQQTATADVLTKGNQPLGVRSAEGARHAC